MTPPPSDLTDQDWFIIGQTPIIAFLLVAAADGKIDKKEANTCADLLTQFSAQQEHPLTAQMMRSALQNMSASMLQLTSSTNPMEALLRVNNLINEKIGGEDATIMKNTVLMMAKKIAEASGGFLGLGNKIDEDEAQALQLLASVFQDDPASSPNLTALPDTPEPTEEESLQWDETKSAFMESLLGAEHDMVMHAMIPFQVGGSLDLYYYPHDIPGTAIATKELSHSPHHGSTNAIFTVYELAMFTRHPLDMEQAKDDTTDFGQAHRNIQTILNPVARYSAEATLNGNETCEFPAEMEGIGGKCLIFDTYKTDEAREFGILVIIEIHRSEMEFARKNSGSALLEKLKAAGHYPYSDMARTPVA